MLGALAWQATTLIKMIVVSRGEIARGLFYFSPGFSPLCPGVLCCVAVTTDPSSSWHNVLPSRIDHGATYRTSKLPQPYHGMYGSCMKYTGVCPLACLELSCHCWINMRSALQEPLCWGSCC